MISLIFIAIAGILNPIIGGESSLFRGTKMIYSHTIN